MKVYIRENAPVARIAAAKMKVDKVAIVFGSTIYLHNCSRDELLKDSDWLCHELKHVQQFRENGFALFLIKYLAEWIRHGYYNNKYEVEARNSEKDLSLLIGTTFI